jgi:Amt family ammonium transporter
MAVVTVIWAVGGTALRSADLHRTSAISSSPFWRASAPPNTDYAGTIPQATFMVYQLMFAIITPALISGAFAGANEVQRDAAFHGALGAGVYFPMAHMVWGKEGLLNAFLGGQIPTFDFAGGTVVHITSGVSA